MVAVPRDGFHQISGATDRYRKRADSGREVDLVRCADCGTRLWHEPLSAPIVTLAAGTLDDPSWVVPACEIWVERASPAAIFHADAMRFHGQPERQAKLDACTPLYGDGA